MYLKEEIKSKNDSLLKLNLNLSSSIKVEENWVQGSLLLPEFLEEFYSERVRIFKNKYLKYLFDSYGHLLVQCYENDFELEYLFLNNHQSINLGYQEKGLNLQKKWIRVTAEIWAKFKQLKHFLNQSVCKIVSMMVYLDWLGIVEFIPKEVRDFIVPEKQSNLFIYKSSLYSKSSYFYRRSRYRRFKFG